MGVEMKMKLITESRFDVAWKAVDEDGKNLYIEGIFSSAEIMNENGRRYRKNILEREIDKMQDSIKNRCAWGELSHPVTPKINEDRIAILVESLKWDGDNVVGRAKVLPTPMGNIARTLIDHGRIGISSRGLGTVNETDNYVNDDYNLICYDLVSSPSNDPSWVKGIYEGKEFEVPDNKIEVIPEEKVEEKVDEALLLEEARKEWHRHIWQVIEQIGRKI
jgi:hypothetical protein